MEENTFAVSFRDMPVFFCYGFNYLLPIHALCILD